MSQNLWSTAVMINAIRVSLFLASQERLLSSADNLCKQFQVRSSVGPEFDPNYLTLSVRVYAVIMSKYAE